MLACDLRRLANTFRKLIPLSLAQMGRSRTGAPAGKRFPLWRPLVGHVDERRANPCEQSTQPARVLEILFRRYLEKPQSAPGRGHAQPTFLQCETQVLGLARKAVAKL